MTTPLLSPARKKKVEKEAQQKRTKDLAEKRAKAERKAKEEQGKKDATCAKNKKEEKEQRKDEEQDKQRREATMTDSAPKHKQNVEKAKSDLIKAEK